MASANNQHQFCGSDNTFMLNSVDIYVKVVSFILYVHK